MDSGPEGVFVLSLQAVKLLWESQSFLVQGCLSQSKPTVTISVPSIVKNGSEPIVLDCVYEFDKWNPLSPEEEGLVVKWYFKESLVYQWIAGSPPQAAGLFTNRLNPDFTISNEPAQKFRAIQIATPTSELSGDYSCFVGSFNAETTSAKKKMTVYVPETQMLLYAPRRSTTEIDRKFEVRCEAQGVYPEPNMTISSRESLDANDDVSVHIETTNVDGLYNIQAWIEMVDRGDSNPITFDCFLRIPDANYTVHKSIIYYPILTTTTTTTTTTTPPPPSYRTSPRTASNRTVRTHYLDPDLFRANF
ncbi:hypothetical protein GE061_009259 [Apolygus lucorum]|uniref:Ig-like domain-containing protein n=1 Tax=Apolygus lucorum TaxID=248454 RepID=A0A8S9Y2E6_APOLU|nr:hypothetical protein GE061_009259 [Apolygus lucorum]